MTCSTLAELPWLVRLATRLTRDADVAEDGAQETIVAAWRRADQLRDPAALRGWLRRSLVNRVIDRSRARHDELDIEAVEAEWADDAWTVQPERVLERAELRDELEDALTRLPAILRIPVVLHDAVGWTSPEIAEAMGIGLPAAKQRLRRGRMTLVTALADDDAAARKPGAAAALLGRPPARLGLSRRRGRRGHPPCGRAPSRDLPDVPTALRRAGGRARSPGSGCASPTPSSTRRSPPASSVGSRYPRPRTDPHPPGGKNVR